MAVGKDMDNGALMRVFIAEAVGAVQKRLLELEAGVVQAEAAV